MDPVMRAGQEGSLLIKPVKVIRHKALPYAACWDYGCQRQRASAVHACRNIPAASISSWMDAEAKRCCRR